MDGMKLHILGISAKPFETFFHCHLQSHMDGGLITLFKRMWARCNLRRRTISTRRALPAQYFA
jgi:hypothetical protein